MTVEDVKKLKTGDVVMCNSRKLRVEYVDETRTNYGYWKFYDYYASTPYNQIIVNYGSRFNYQTDFMKTLSPMNTETILLEKISEKETELENLKKELEELTRKKMLDQIIPGNVYRFDYAEYPQETFYGYIRKIENHHIMVDLIKTSTQIGMEIKYRAFVLNDIHNVELLPELTEAYKNFKTILESV